MDTFIAASIIAVCQDALLNQHEVMVSKSPYSQQTSVTSICIFVASDI